ncbi:hypothetical protein OU426_08450 [Frigidibacter sp. RF13]|nr:hypothetical protein [Frigidibacter sp. RF13]
MASGQETVPPPGWPEDTAVQTEAGQQIPAGALGIAQIETPRVATLLQLRGVTGKGVVILKSSDSQDCLTLLIRFVAGDFGGDGISARAAEPIRLIIRSARVADALVTGGDVVSNMYRVSSRTDDPKADIVIESGLRESHGFVLNPGNSILADIFGAAVSRTACSAL